eukprot:359872-Chlamydomonas_euryale.AAC.2
MQQLCAHGPAFPFLDFGPCDGDVRPCVLRAEDLPVLQDACLPDHRHGGVVPERRRGPRAGRHRQRHGVAVAASRAGGLHRRAAEEAVARRVRRGEGAKKGQVWRHVSGGQKPIRDERVRGGEGTIRMR